MWPATPEELERTQRELAAADPPSWDPDQPPAVVASCFVCFQRGKQGPGAPGDQGWAGATLLAHGEVISEAAVTAPAPAEYRPGLLALREGPLLEAAVRQLPRLPEVLLVNATGRDHPRRAGLALHLGAVFGIPTIGVTARPLVAEGEWPEDRPGARRPLRIGPEVVGYWLRTQAGTNPLAVHAAWRTGPFTAVAVVSALVGPWRTPAPLRHARRIAREARAGQRAAVDARLPETP